MAEVVGWWMFSPPDGAPPAAALAHERIVMTDAFEAQGEFAPVQSDEFAVAGEILSTLDAVEPAAEAKPNGFIKLGLAPEL
ncbi:MAG TPA: ATP-dependent helicase, partial [Variovorax sp.]